MVPFFAVWWWLHPDYMAVAGVLVGLTTLVVAAWIATRQFQVTGEQTAIARRQEAIAVRQGEIAETQYRTAQEQIGRRANPSVALAFEEESAERLVFRLSLRNGGRKTMRGSYWHLAVPRDVMHGLGFSFDVPYAKWVLKTIKTGDYYTTSGMFDGPVFPTRSVRIGLIQIKRALVRTRWPLGWYVVCEDGQFPEDEETMQRGILISPEFLIELQTTKEPVGDE